MGYLFKVIMAGVLGLPCSARELTPELRQVRLPPYLTTRGLTRDGYSPCNAWVDLRRMF